MFDSGIDYLIYPRQGKIIIWEYVIPVGVINADSTPSIFLWDYHHVHKPVQILDFSDKSDCQQFVNFCLDDFLSVRMEKLDRLRGGCDINLVRGHDRMNSRHIRVSLGKNVFIALKHIPQQFQFILRKQGASITDLICVV